MAREIGSVRILAHDSVVNKGTGLRFLSKLIQIEEGNIIYIGDSAGDKTNDTLVKTIMPHSTLMITDNGDEAAKEHADFVVGSVETDGVPLVIRKLIEFQEMYSTCA